MHEVRLELVCLENADLNPYSSCKSHPQHVTLAGGSGVCAQLWRHVFRPNGVVHAALELLKFCPSCSGDHGYVGGCPACIQVGECIKFNDFLCRKSAFAIGDHLLKQLQKTEVYKTNMNEKYQRKDEVDCSNNRKRSDCSEVLSPRRKRRQGALRAAKDIKSAQQRQTVVGRPSWPMDHSDAISQLKIQEE
jgi:ATP-dependent helicase YprA (DUF1998 family)